MGFFDLIGDVVTVVAAPVKVAVAVTEAVVKPVAKGAKAVVEEIQDILE